MDSRKEHLKSLFSQTSKHSNYQILPECLKLILSDDDIVINSRYEKERLHYILSQVNPANRTILDIGGNSGYFSLELLDKGASHVDYYEGNAAHSEFVKASAEILNFSDRINIYNEYYDFSAKSHSRYDIVLLLNVLHHVGDDYGDKDLSVEEAKKQITKSINYFAGKSRYLVFQLGFCWKGNRETLLFENGTKEEMINFIKESIEMNWEMLEVAVPEIEGDGIAYKPLNKKNIKRNDSMGEFLNRPIFILTSKKLL